MNSQYFVWGLAAVAASLVLAVAAPIVAAVVVGTLAAGSAIYWIGRCHHPGPLGLLPPTVAEDGTRTPSRWYCDACGKSWPAGLESERASVVRFSGYDESKLPAAAERAAALERQRRALAVKRADLVAGRSESTPAAGNVTSIKNRRVAG